MGRCDACPREDLQIFYIQSTSKAFLKIKEILGLDKKRFNICENHYPPDSVLRINGKVTLNKDARDLVPTINMPKSDPTEHNIPIESIPTNELSIAGQSTATLNNDEINMLTLQANPAEEMEKNESVDKKKERFQSYKNVELPEDWSMIEDGDDEIIFENSENKFRVKVTSEFKFTIIGREKRYFIQEGITNEELQNILDNVETINNNDED